MKDSAGQAAVSTLLCHSHQQPHWPVTGSLMRHRGRTLGSPGCLAVSFYHHQVLPLQSNRFPISQPEPWASWVWWSVWECVRLSNVFGILVFTAQSIKKSPNSRNTRRARFYKIDIFQFQEDKDSYEKQTIRWVFLSSSDELKIWNKTLYTVPENRA